ncbi:MAG: hypothetical protein ACKO4L_11655, partial [Nodosilinea sp.]
MIALVGGLGVVGLGLAHRAQVWQPAYVRPLWPVYPQIAAQADIKTISPGDQVPGVTGKARPTVGVTLGRRVAQHGGPLHPGQG